jgi:copper(I)-binding protein
LKVPAWPLSIAGVGIAALLVSGCQQDRPLYVDGAYVRLSPNPDNPAAGYLTVHGGAQDVTLRAIETDTALRLEMHESKAEGKVMMMKPLKTVAVPARSKIAFEPGGKHLMIWTINPQAIAAGKMEFKLIFSNGDRILVDAVIQGPDGKPTGNDLRAPTAGAEDSHTEMH